MRSWIERQPADDQATVVATIERAKQLQREGWQLTLLHQPKPTPQLLLLAWLPDNVQLRLDQGRGGFH